MSDVVIDVVSTDVKKNADGVCVGSVVIEVPYGQQRRHTLQVVSMNDVRFDHEPWYVERLAMLDATDMRSWRLLYAMFGAILAFDRAAVAAGGAAQIGSLFAEGEAIARELGVELSYRTWGEA